MPERLRVRAGTVAALLFLGSCTTLGALAKSQAALKSEGFRDPSVSLSEVNGVDHLSVRYTTRAETASGVPAEQRDVALIVWKSAPVRIDDLQVEAVGGPAAEVAPLKFSREEMEQAFGPRSPGLTESDRGDFGREVVRYLVIAAVAVAVLSLIVTIALLTFFARRRRRRREQVDAAMIGRTS
jgi:hypothetical protein